MPGTQPIKLSGQALEHILQVMENTPANPPLFLAWDDSGDGFLGNRLLVTVEYPEHGSVQASSIYEISRDVEAYEENRDAIDITNNYIIVTSDTFIEAFSGDFNGTHYFDIDGTIPDIQSVNIVADNVQEFDASDMSFDEDNIWMNFESATFTPSSYVIVHVDFA